jgi:hypothetical protein
MVSDGRYFKPFKLINQEPGMSYVIEITWVAEVRVTIYDLVLQKGRRISFQLISN